MFPPPENARKPLGLTHNALISTQYLKVHIDNSEQVYYNLLHRS